MNERIMEEAIWHHAGMYRDSNFIDRVVKSVDHRLCVVCGKWWAAKDWNKDQTPCSEPGEYYRPCSLDLTLPEAADYWRRMYHDVR
jgi:hypothetical protein